jgi:hypothetical protein
MCFNMFVHDNDLILDEQGLVPFRPVVSVSSRRPIVAMTVIRDNRIQVVPTKKVNGERVQGATRSFEELRHQPWFFGKGEKQEMKSGDEVGWTGKVEKPKLQLEEVRIEILDPGEKLDHNLLFVKSEEKRG